MERATVVVVWTGYRPGPWAVRSLRAAGYRVVGVHPEVSGGRSLACPLPRRIPDPDVAPAAFLGALERICREERAAAVLPLGEDVVGVLAPRAPAVGGAVLAGPGPRAHAMLCDKTELARTARAAGVATPRTATVTGEGRVGDWPALPAVVKPRGSVGVPAALAGPEVVWTEEDRDAAVARLLDAGGDAVVQERVTGGHLSVHCMRHEGVTHGVAFRILRTHPRLGGMPSLFAPLDDPAAVLDASRRLLEAADYSGPANVQFLVGPGGPAVHDVNLRPPATVALSIRAGLDLPRLAVDAALGRPVAIGPLDAGLGYLSIADELKALAADGAEPGGWRIARDIAGAVVSRRTVVDPPLRDPLWAAQEALDALRERARRVVRRAR
jgi:carbamoyl-phosphate synthase large subunit